MTRKLYLTISIILFLASAFLIINSANNISGYVIFDNGKPITSVAGIFLLIVAIAVYGLGIMASTDLDELVTKHPSLNISSGVKVYISKRAIERAQKDPRVGNNIGKYMKEVSMIAADYNRRPQERIGAFRVSPQGRSTGGLRVAWHLGRNPDGELAIYIDDFLYHTGSLDYVDRWNVKAREGNIMPGNQGGYVRAGIGVA